MTNKVPNIRFKGFTDDWEQRKLGEILKYEQPGPYIVNSTDYDDSFSTPVLTAGQSFILGYTNETEGIKYASKENPVIIFDDFTTSSHLVDFPFKVKSSAMKLLSLRKNEDDIYFMVNTLKNIKYIPASHERHWISIFSEFNIPIPCNNVEQQKIGEYFSNLDHLITLHQRKCEQTKELKKFMLQKMFPKKGEKNPEIRFPGFTDAWEQRKLDEVANYRNGKAHENDIYDDGDYIVINSKFVSTDGEVKKYSNVQNEPLYEGEIAFVLSDVPNGRAIARTFLVDKSGKYTLNQRIAGITPHDNTDAYYLHIKLNRNAYFLKFDDGNKQTNLSIKDVLNYEDYYPCYEEQKKIGDYFKSLDHLITLHQRKCEQLKELKKFMLQNMFPKKG
ncbi:restriction endonuclease subunit S [Streptococcus equinus]|uniref:restriction endonuclease subunit S n=1 Tax=Streptococcus equinus TaxID=1335 RepID=UPI0010703CC9|nr:restriction endonuclease subunit S [Streptococcus equinus]TFH45039.1 restriction endonuclease subunit S [Streptococcus equinus]